MKYRVIDYYDGAEVVYTADSMIDARMFCQQYEKDTDGECDLEIKALKLRYYDIKFVREDGEIDNSIVWGYTKKEAIAMLKEKYGNIGEIINICLE